MKLVLILLHIFNSLLKTNLFLTWNSSCNVHLGPETNLR